MPESSSDSAPIPPSPPSSAAEERGGGTALPLALAVAAAVSCWNAFGAPFALPTAAVALVLALRVRAPAGRRRTRARVAAGIAAAALVASALTLSGFLRAATPDPAVRGAPTPYAGDAQTTLDGAAGKSAERREAARRELEQLGPGSPQEAERGAPR